MKSRLMVVLAAVVTMTATATQNVGAQDYFAPASYDSNPVSYNTNYTTTANDSYTSRIEALESEIANLRANVGTRANGGCDGCDGGCDGGCGGAGCCTSCVSVCDPYCEEEFCPAWQFQADMTLLRLHKTGGVQTGSNAFVGRNPEGIELGFIASPRFTLRRYNERGMFNEIVYFEYNHSATGNAIGGGDTIHVRNYTFDWSIGERFQLNRDWDVEFAGGSRIHNYRERLMDGPLFNHHQTNSVGGIFRMEASRRMGQYSFLYGGARFAITQGDSRIIENRGAPTNVRLTDEHYVHLELFSGGEYVRPLGGGAEMYFRYGVEWISYEGVSSQFNGSAPGLAAHETAVIPGADIGLGGFTISMGIYR